MSPESPLPRPTDAELAILRVLWHRGVSTVREVLDELNQPRPEPLAYTTVLRFLQIMTEKGLVQREGDERGHRYRPTAPEECTKQQLVGDLLERAFGGSTHELVLQALGTGKISAAEMKEIRRLLDQLES
jgi:BlaI family transcriptional regulator, penicillinase repressor